MHFQENKSSINMNDKVSFLKLFIETSDLSSEFSFDIVSKIQE